MARTRALLERHGLAPRRRDGQNFVVDPNTVRKVVRDAHVSPGELVLEVGPGLGALTVALREAGARVAAIELDGGLVRALREVLGDDPGVTLVHDDALRADLHALLARAAAPAEQAGEPARGPAGDHAGGPEGRDVPAAALVANLPYDAATPIVLRCLRAGVIGRAHVMVQREVGERWVAGVGDPAYGAVSVKVAALASARLAARVSRQAFWPVPRVDSVTVSLQGRPWPHDVDREAVLALVEQGFAARRKRLANALVGAGWDRAHVDAALRHAGLPADVRAERLDLPAWVALTQALGPGLGSPSSRSSMRGTRPCDR